MLMVTESDSEGMTAISFGLTSVDGSLGDIVLTSTEYQWRYFVVILS